MQRCIEGLSVIDGVLASSMLANTTLVDSLLVPDRIICEVDNVLCSVIGSEWKD